MFKKSLFTLALGLACSVANAGIEDSEFLSSYPLVDEDAFTLRDGTVVTMPFHIETATTLIAGTYETKHAPVFIDNKRLESVPVPLCDADEDSEELGLGIFYVQDVKDSPVGAYQETIWTMLVKQSSAADLDLACLNNPEDPVEMLQWSLGAITAVAVANAEKAAAGEPQDYTFYNGPLLLDNQNAVEAGIKGWGYDKTFGNVSVDFGEDTFTVSAATKKGKPLFDISYAREIGDAGDLVSIGDNTLPVSLNPDRREYYSQLNGGFMNKTGSSVWFQPFIGTYEIHSTRSDTTKLLSKLSFNPLAVVEFPDAWGVALPLYVK